MAQVVTSLIHPSSSVRINFYKTASVPTLRHTAAEMLQQRQLEASSKVSKPLVKEMRCLATSTYCTRCTHLMGHRMMWLAFEPQLASHIGMLANNDAEMLESLRSGLSLVLDLAVAIECGEKVCIYDLLCVTQSDLCA